MKATVKIEFKEQSKSVVFDTKIEFEKEIEKEDQLTDLIKLAKAESDDLMRWAFAKTQALTNNK